MTRHVICARSLAWQTRRTHVSYRLRQAIVTRCALKIQKIVRGRRTRKLLLEGWSSEEDYIDSDSSGTDTETTDSDTETTDSG